jgi:hypothetical protein
MKKLPPGATVSDLIGYSLKAKKPVPMYTGALKQLNTLPAKAYSPPVTGWVEIAGVVYLSFENPATYPLSIFMPMAGGYWDGYIYELSTPYTPPGENPTHPGPINLPSLLPKLGFATLAVAGLAAVLILKR